MKHYFTFFTLFFFTISTLSSYSQVRVFSTTMEMISEERINGGFSFETWQSLDIHLCNKEYVLTYTMGGSDMFAVICLSFGTYHKRGKELVLKDRLNGYKMYARYDSDSSMVFTKGPVCMENKTLMLKQLQGELWEGAEVPNIDYKEVNRKRRLYSNQKELYKSLVGDYGYGSFYDLSITPLSLHEDGTYEYRYLFGDLLVSKGTWCRKGNLLVFHDDNLDDSFYALIETDGIVSYYLIGDQKGEKLYLLKK